MKRSISAILFVVTGIVLGTWISGLHAQTETPRTQYEGLALYTPNEAVETFVALFDQRDYVALFYVLSPEAQREWRTRVAATFDYSTWFSDPDLIEQVSYLNADVPSEHDVSLIPMLFDEVMWVAETNNAFVIDLRGVNSISAAELNADESMALVAAQLGSGKPVTFALEPSISGRWRVRQVIVEGGDTDIIPWSAAYDD